MALGKKDFCVLFFPPPSSLLYREHVLGKYWNFLNAVESSFSGLAELLHFKLVLGLALFLMFVCTGSHHFLLESTTVDNKAAASETAISEHILSNYHDAL